MAEENEFAVDSPEMHAAAVAAEAEAQGVPDPTAQVTPPPAPPSEDLDVEAAAGEVPAEVVPGPIPGEPVVEAAPLASVVEAPATPVENRRAPIQSLSESSDISLEGVALETKIILSKQPKVRMMIPLDPGEKAGAYRTVVINGYRFDVRKNTMVDLPESVAKLLQQAYQITSEVLEENPLNLNQANAEKQRALGMT